MEAMWAYFAESFARIEELFLAYQALGEGSEGISLILWLPIVPILFLGISLGVQLKRPIAGAALAIMGEALIGAPLLGAAQGTGMILLFSVLRLLTWVVPAALGWMFPRLMAPLGIGYFVSLAFYALLGEMKLVLVIGGLVALVGVLFWRWSFAHITAFGGARLLAYLVFESVTPLALPLPIAAEYRTFFAYLCTLLLTGVGICVQQNSTRNREMV